MKKWMVAVSVLFLGFSLICEDTFARKRYRGKKSSSSSGRRIGVGGFVGLPFGVTGKYRLNRRQSLELGAGYFFNNTLHFYGAFTYSFPKLITDNPLGNGKLVAYAGGGPALEVDLDAFTDRASFGIRIPLGVEWFRRRTFTRFYLELAPGLYFTPEVGAFAHIIVGVRQYL